ncbi:hypothetical protein [Jiella marina]|uniref:hypothetical protein n=1 Tax=Jiella sp. LLJ827 TaxID=2917712 RepID=UPI0021007816|nr:hypothetical protein [Jiella sp. LLJ827]MCQ0988733.1 hypothetical protein [Jiella sp. LLJ827]
MNGKTPWLVAALCGFLVFIANVALGASGSEPLIGRVGEVLLIFLSSILFVIGTLKAEARRRDDLAKIREETP